MKIILLSCLFFLIVGFRRQQEQILRISQVKNLILHHDDSLQNYNVRGYLYVSSVPMLVTGMKWTQINTPMPDSVFLILGGDWINKNWSYLKKYQGRPLIVTGKLNGRNSIELSYNDDVRPDILLTRAPATQH